MRIKNQKTKEKTTGITERAYNFSLEIIKISDDLSGISGNAIANQLVRSATSVGANIVEAQAGSSRKDFTNFLFYALKSANETNYWLSLLKDSKKLESSKANALITEVCEIANMLGASVKTLRTKNE